MTNENKPKVYAFPNSPSPAMPVEFNPEHCNGCLACVNVCPMDVFIPNPEKKRPPLVLFPDECWYCSSCVLHCPKPGAIRTNFPLMWKVPWRRKTTGEHHWVGVKTPKPSSD